MKKSLRIKMYIMILTVLSFTALYSTFLWDSYHWNGMDDNIDSNDPYLTQKKLFNRLYFSITTTSTVGYGDISPRTTLARILVLLNILTIVVEGISILHEFITG